MDEYNFNTKRASKRKLFDIFSFCNRTFEAILFH